MKIRRASHTPRSGHPGAVAKSVHMAFLSAKAAVVHEPTLASHIERLAIDELLLTQRRQVATLFVQPAASSSARRHIGPAPPPLPAQRCNQRLLGFFKRWRCFSSCTLLFRNGGVIFAVVPCVPLRLLSYSVMHFSRSSCALPSMIKELSYQRELASDVSDPTVSVLQVDA